MTATNLLPGQHNKRHLRGMFSPIILGNGSATTEARC